MSQKGPRPQEPIVVTGTPPGQLPVGPPHPSEGQPPQGVPPGETIEHPGKLLRIASMIRELLEEVRQATLDEGGRRSFQSVYERSLEELKGVLSENLQKELEALATPLSESPSQSELRVAQAQLVGWLEGLFHGIQAALWAQQAMARAQFEEVRRRGLPSHAAPPTDRPESPGSIPGQYL